MNLKLKQLRRLVESSFPEIDNFFEKVTVDFEKQEDVKSFWSEIYFAKLEVKDGVEGLGELPPTVFVKVPRVGDNVHRTEDVDNLGEAYNALVYYSKKENLFYSHFAHNSIPLFPFPRVYHSEDITGEATGGLVAENLADKVYAVEHVPGLNEHKVRRLMEALAGLHAHLIRATDKGYVKSFEEGAHGREVFTAAFQKMMLDEALFLETVNPEIFGNGRMKELEWAFDYEYKKKVTEEAVNAIPGILVHADMNVTNLLWTRNSDEIAAIIDFQMVIIGSVAHDIIRILTLTLPREERKRTTEQYLRHYFDTLNTFFAEEPFSWQELLRQYCLIYPVASNFTLFGISIYIKMYSDGTLGTPEFKDQNIKELIDRARGIVEDMEEMKPKQI